MCGIETKTAQQNDTQRINCTQKLFEGQLTDSLKSSEMFSFSCIEISMPVQEENKN